MSNKIYSYKDKSYKMAPLNLGLMNKAAPLLIKYRKLHYEYTKDIDMSRVEAIQNRIDELKTAISQVESGTNAGEDRLAALRSKLAEAENELNDDVSLRNLMRFYRDSEGLAMYELITDAKVVKPLLSNIMIPADSESIRDKLREQDFNVPEIFDFIKEVLTDFFSYTLQNRPK